MPCSQPAHRHLPCRPVFEQTDTAHTHDSTQTCGPEAVSAPRRGRLPHLPTENSCTLLTMPFYSERLSPAREAQGSHTQRKEKRRQPAEQDGKIGVLKLEKSICNPLTVTLENNTAPASVTTPSRQHKPILHRCREVHTKTPIRGWQAIQERVSSIYIHIVFHPPQQEPSTGDCTCFHNIF